MWQHIIEGGTGLIQSLRRLYTLHDYIVPRHHVNMLSCVAIWFLFIGKLNKKLELQKGMITFYFLHLQHWSHKLIQ